MTFRRFYLTFSFVAIAIMATASSAALTMRIGDVTVAPSSLATASCIQVPIFISEPDASRELKDLTFTVELGGDTGIINGGIVTDMLVVNGFGTGANFIGISNPGTDLANINGSATPTCSSIFNQATQGAGPAVDFAIGAATATAFINNNGGGIGRKSGFLINLGDLTLIDTVMGEEYLVGVLEIPISANPGTGQLTITATPDAVVTDANSYTFSRAGGPLVAENTVLPALPAIVNIVQTLACSGATVADDLGPASGSDIAINYLDLTAGGVGGELTFSIPTPVGTDRITVESGGFSQNLTPTPATTMLIVNSAADGIPNSAIALNNYTITHEVEFPPASGTFVGGTPCQVSTTWAPASCSVSFDPAPVLGGDTVIAVEMTNVEFIGGRFGNLTGPNAIDEDLLGPSFSGPILTFDPVTNLINIDPSDQGLYAVTGQGPGSNAACDAVINFSPAAPIPTMSAMAMGLLALSLAMLGLLLPRRRMTT